MSELRRGRPPSAATLAKLTAPCCEKCRHLKIGERGAVKCGRFYSPLTAVACADFTDVSRPSARVLGGISGVYITR